MMDGLLECLESTGRLTGEQVLTAQKRIGRTGQSPEDAILALGFIPEDELYREMAALYGLELCETHNLQPQEEALARIPYALAQQLQCLPVKVNDGAITVAFAHQPKARELEQLQLLAGLPCRPILATPTQIAAGRQRFYGLGAGKVNRLKGRIDEEQKSQLVDYQEVTPQEDNSVASLVNEVLETALNSRATDIHIEPFPGRLRLRFRIDGLLRDVPTPEGIEFLKDSIVSRLKVMAHLDIAEKRLPHDGRLRITRKDGAWDLRASLLPTRYGETVCLRILNAGNLLTDMEQLGLSQDHLASLQRQLRRPSGLMLVTGPTGSGKTTTLYSILVHLMNAHPDLKIITVEDPVEYDIPGITQIQTNAEIGLTFSSALRSILRHDPDVILVGEIRDRETAEIAIQAAQTGHLVLSTLHTTDAVGAVNRLINMGVEPDLVASTLRCIVAQRLVRRLCPHCSLVDDNVSHEDEKELRRIGKRLGLAHAHPRKASPEGCFYCQNSGYYGRIGVYEILEINGELEDRISAGTPNGELRKCALEQGWTPLAGDACEKVLLGLTDLAELHRIC